MATSYKDRYLRTGSVGTIGAASCPDLQEDANNRLLRCPIQDARGLGSTNNQPYGPSVRLLRFLMELWAENG